MFTLVRLDMTIFSEEESTRAVFLVLAAIFLGSALWWFFLSTIINIFRKKFRLKQLIIINKISGIVIAALGVISFGEGLFLILKQYIM